MSSDSNQKNQKKRPVNEAGRVVEFNPVIHRLLGKRQPGATDETHTVRCHLGCLFAAGREVRLGLRRSRPGRGAGAPRPAELDSPEVALYGPRAWYRDLLA